MLRALIIAFALALSGCASLSKALDAITAIGGQSLVYEDDLGRIELLQTGCPDKVKELLRESVQAQFKAAVFTHKASGTVMNACWIVPENQDANSDTVVYLHFEDNDRSLLLMKKFTIPSKSGKGI